MRDVITARALGARGISLLVVAASVVVRLSPPLGVALVYDRVAIAGGQYWRLLTSNLVHFSWLHLAGDAVMLVVAGWLLDGARRRVVVALYGGAALSGSLAVYAFAPELRWYGGLSGVAHAAVVYAALCGVFGIGRGGRVLSTVALMLVAAKIAVDARVPRLVPGVSDATPVVVAHVSHLGAVAVAIALFAGTMFTKRFGRGRPTAVALGDEASGLEVDHAKRQRVRLEWARDPHPVPDVRT